MFEWLFNRKMNAHEQAATPEPIKNASPRRPVRNFVYPPVANGIPRVPVSAILEEYGELIRRLRNLSGNEIVFDERFLPALKRFANYVHLLPASEAHHHRGAGGLFCHGLETAKYALKRAHGRLHGMQLSPQKRKDAQERWLFADFVSGVTHDLGKVVDMRVHSVSGQTWEPFSQPMAEWYRSLPPHDERVFVSWRREGHDHRQTGLLLLHHILLPGDIAYLQEIEPMFMWITQAILGTKQPPNDITTMLEEGDKQSVSKNLQNSNVLADLGPETRQPLIRHLVMAMKRLVKDGRWRANEPGSVLWVMGNDQGCYLVWPEMGVDIVKLLQTDEIPGIPANPEAVADILAEYDLLMLAPNGNRLWRIRPSKVKADGKGLLALRLSEPRYLLDLVPPSVPGEVRGEGEKISITSIGRPDLSIERSHGKESGVTQTLPSSPGFLEEPEPLRGPRPMDELQRYFAGGGLGGQALLELAFEVSRGARREGIDYQTIPGPQLLLTWGKRKFTEKKNLSEVIESLAQVGWLVTNGNRRVHEEPEVGRCLKLQEKATVLFLRLLNLLRGAGEDAINDSYGQDKGIHPREPEGLPESPVTPEAEEPGWVAEVADMINLYGPVDYNRARNIVVESIGERQDIFMLLSRHFEISDDEGELVVVSRKD